MRIPLAALALILKENVPKFEYKVKTVYEDFGAGLLWDNIIVYDDTLKMDYQLLYRKEMEILEFGTPEEQCRTIQDIISKLENK